MNDPVTWVRPFTASQMLPRTEGPLFEYACHEGNYGLQNALAGARAEEREMAEQGDAGQE